MGKELKLYAALDNGRVLSRSQIKAQFKLRNPSAAIHRFVNDAGISVRRTYTTKKVKGNYITTVKYSFDDTFFDGYNSKKQ